MQNVNVSYINTYQAPDWPRLRRAAFNWSLLGFFVLDLILLFWLLNPFEAAAAQRSRVFATRVQTVEASDSFDKPSPLGTVVVHPRALRARASLQASAR